MKYKAYLEQGGEGCDYTIGCGKIVVNLESTNMEDAMRELSELILEEYGSDESMIDTAELYEVGNVIKMDLDKLYNVRDEFIREREQEAEDERERAEFVRLSKKFSK